MVFVVFVIALQTPTGNNPDVIQESARPPGVFGKNQIGTVEDPARPRREITEGTDGCGDDPQNSTVVRHVVMIAG